MPAGQGVGEERPLFGHVVPAGHMIHAVGSLRLSESLYLPGGQGVGDEEPSVTGPNAVSTELPEAGQYAPFGHGKQAPGTSDAFFELYVPAGHGIILPPWQDPPSGQGSCVSIGGF